MRFPSDIALQALRLAKYAQENDMSNPASLAMYIPKGTYGAVQGMVPEARRLEETSSMKGGVSIPLTQGDGYDFKSVMENPYFQKIKKCGIDLEEMTTTFMAGAMFPDTFSEEDTMQKILSAFGNDVTKEQCEPEQLMTAVKAAQGFMGCTNLDKLVQDFALHASQMEKIGDNIEEKCTPVSEALLSAFPAMALAFDDDEEGDVSFPSMEDMNACLGSIFGPKNFIGKAVRQIYEHPKLYCDCAQTYAAQVPDCTLDEGGITVSLGLVKTEACAIGVACDQYEEHCKVEESALDKCLPQLGDVDLDCSDVMRTCATGGSVFAMVPPLISTTIPDICKEAITPEVSERYTSFQQRCKGNKDYFAEVFNDKGEVVINAPALSLASQTSYVSKEENTVPDEKNESSSSSHKFAIFGAFVLVVGTALFFIKKKIDQKDDFTPLSTNGLDFEAA